MLDYKSLFDDVRANVPAYKKMMEGNSEPPILTKTNYLMAFKPEELCRPSDMDNIHLIGASSGFSKSGSVYWPKRPQDEAGYMDSIETMLRQYYNLDGNRTLVVECLALGMWIGGVQIASALRYIALSGRYRLAVATPGLDLKAAVDVINLYGKRFSQILVITNPSNISLLAALLEKAGVDIRSGNMRFPVVGEYFSEAFRTRTALRFGHSEDDPFVVWTGYGSADTGDIGAETEATIRLRKLFDKDKALARKIFLTDDAPMILALSPKVYVEIIDGEIVVTKDQFIPLIRYNTKDSGGLLRRNELKGIVPDELYETLPEEMIYVYGRVGNAVIFYGTNLTVNSINEYFLSLPANRCYGGLFTVHQADNDGIASLEFVVYVTDTNKTSPDIWLGDLVGFLKSQSAEFAYKYDHLSTSADRQLITLSLADITSIDSKVKHKYII